MGNPFERPPQQPPSQNKLEDLPGGPMSEHHGWLRKRIGGKEVGVTDPQGNYHPLEEEEGFAVETDREARTYQAVAIGKNGERRVLYQGQIFKDEGEAETENKAEELNVEMLKSISQKCVENSPRGDAVRFGKDISLTDAEESEINRLIETASRNLDNLTNQESLKPLWDKFVNILEQRRKKVGHFGENECIIEDSSAKDITKELKDTESGQVPVIRVPVEIKSLYHWSTKIRNFKEQFVQYQQGLRKDTSARDFGRDIKELFRFHKESMQIQGK
jgi:uncharacterized protein involved in tolerance to divalent cations